MLVHCLPQAHLCSDIAEIDDHFILQFFGLADLKSLEPFSDHVFDVENHGETKFGVWQEDGTFIAVTSTVEESFATYERPVGKSPEAAVGGQIAKLSKEAVRP